MTGFVLKCWEHLRALDFSLSFGLMVSKTQHKTKKVDSQFSVFLTLFLPL
jgi:hypothetical protein